MLVEQDSKGYISLYGIYLNAKPYLERECKRHGYRVPKYETFSKIIRTFLTEVLNAVIYDYKTVTLPYRYGTIQGIKTLCTKFNPKKVYWVRENGKNVKKVEKIDVNEFDGYFYSVIWNFADKFKKYRFTLSKEWKKKLFTNVLEGADYPIRG